ncbi:MAG: hypothetical protein OXC62_16110 [Aestuariivita sp.]|nr:hypothetical protein [Aestuariivita sp.]
MTNLMEHEAGFPPLARGVPSAEVRIPKGKWPPRGGSIFRLTVRRKVCRKARLWRFRDCIEEDDQVGRST